MADERYRRLERAVTRGDVAAQGQLLRERVRVGALDPESLELAAGLGDPAASVACLGEAPGRAERLEPWVRDFAAWETAVSVRAALILAATEPGTSGSARAAAQRWLAVQAAEAGPAAW